MGKFLSTVEQKVKAAALGTLAASVVAAIINALLNGSPIPTTPHAWVQFALIVAGPPVAAFISGYQARHTSVPPVVTINTGSAADIAPLIRAAQAAVRETPPTPPAAS